MDNQKQFKGKKHEARPESKLRKFIGKDGPETPPGG